MIDLTTLKRTKQTSALRIVVHGGPKVGKSTFAAGFPNPVFIRTEDGLGAIDAVAFPICTSYQDVIDQIDALGGSDHDFETLVIDSLDWLEPLVHAHVCKQYNVATIEKVLDGYGKGYAEASKVFADLLCLLDQLREVKGMNIVLIAHSEVKTNRPPDSEVFDVQTPKLNKGAVAKFFEWCDFIGYADVERSVTGAETDKKGKVTKAGRARLTGGRFLHLGKHPAYISGSRWPMPDRIPLDYASFNSALNSNETKKEGE